MEIEFVEPPPEQVSERLAPPAARPRGVVLGVLASAMFAGATALAVTAPFQRLYLVRIRVAGFTEVVVSDGWGRMGVRLANGTADPQHAGRYGVVFVSLGGLCAVATLVAAAGLLRPLPPPVRGCVTPVALAASAALAAATVMMWLDAASVLDNARRVPGQEAGGTLAEHVSVQADYGPAHWLAAAAAACAIGGTLLTGWSGRLRRRTPESVPSPAPEPVTVADHELGEPLTW